LGEVAHGRVCLEHKAHGWTASQGCGKRSCLPRQIHGIVLLDVHSLQVNLGIQHESLVSPARTGE
jgi:hypothetical protein